MARGRLEENKGLPDRWVRKHGAIYYVVPSGLERYWNYKKWFRLGSNVSEANKTWSLKVAEMSDAGSVTIPDVSSLTKSPLVMCGVYFLYLGGEVVYVGRSNSVLERISTHIRRGVKFDSYSVTPADGAEQERLEQIMIAKYTPILNVRCLELVV